MTRIPRSNRRATCPPYRRDEFVVLRSSEVINDDNASISHLSARDCLWRLVHRLRMVVAARVSNLPAGGDGSNQYTESNCAKLHNCSTLWNDPVKSASSSILSLDALRIGGSRASCRDG